MFKWVGIVLGGFIGIIILAAVVLYIIGTFKINKTSDIQDAAVAVSTDA